MADDHTIDALLEPGVLVRHPRQPEWGIGQVQAVDPPRVTVNFPETGKQVIDARIVRLTYIGPDPRSDGQGVYAARPPRFLSGDIAGVNHIPINSSVAFRRALYFFGRGEAHEHGIYSTHL